MGVRGGCRGGGGAGGERRSTFSRTKRFESRFAKVNFHTNPSIFFLKSVIVKNKLTDFWGSSLLRNDFINIFCGIRTLTSSTSESGGRGGWREGEIQRNR